MKKQRLGTLVTFRNVEGEWRWIMRPQVASALEALDWVQRTFLPEEVISKPGAPLVEGSVSRVTVNAYERNPKARAACIAAHGSNCCICGFSFGDVYGPIGDGYIHVHHLRPLSRVGEQYEVDPVADLRPICANCHAVVHLHDPAFTIDEARALLRR